MNNFIFVTGWYYTEDKIFKSVHTENFFPVIRLCKLHEFVSLTKKWLKKKKPRAKFRYFTYIKYI
jgi:hypothetical protein